MKTNQQARAEFLARHPHQAPGDRRRQKWVAFIGDEIQAGRVPPYARMWPCPKGLTSTPPAGPRGGARAGAGRKPLEAGLGLTEVVKLRLTPLQRDALEQLGGVAFLRGAIDAAVLAEARAERINALLEQGYKLGQAADIAKQELGA